MNFHSKWIPPKTGMGIVPPLDQRWLYLTNAVQSGDYSGIPEDDPCVRAALWVCRYLKEQPSSMEFPPDVDLRSIEGIANAWKIYFNGNQKNTRILVEACMYARLTDREIGERIGIAPDVVGWYRFLFHDLLNYLDYPMFVCQCEPFLGKFQSPEGAEDQALLLKVVAFHRGADAMLRMAAGPEFLIAEDWDWINRVLRKRWLMETFNAVRSFQPTNGNTAELIKLGRRIQKFEALLKGESREDK